MKKTDNPVFVFAAVAAVVFLIIAGWLFLPWFKDAAPKNVVTEEKVMPDTLPTFLVVSDIHLNSDKLQADIPNRASDSGHDLWDTAQGKLRKILAGSEGFTKPGFMIVLGDLPWHAFAASAAELESAHANSGAVLHDIRTLAQHAGVPLIYVSGNNDPWDGDYYPFSTKIFAMDTACKNCWPYVGGDKAETIDTTELHLGCYTCYPLGKARKLKVVVLNTTLFVNGYKDAEGMQQKKTTEELQWFSTQLRDASSAGEYVLVVMHVPPGLDGYKKKDFWNTALTFNGIHAQDAFLDTLNRYQNEVVGLLSSHTHMDGLRKLNDRQGKLMAVDISLPGIAPGHGNNPGFKLISYNPTNFALQNFITFYEDYFGANKVVAWGASSYDFRSVFGCPAGTSIKRFLDTLNTASLQKGVQAIYTVKNGVGKASEVDTAIEVRYQ